MESQLRADKHLLIAKQLLIDAQLADIARAAKKRRDEEAQKERVAEETRATKEAERKAGLPVVKDVKQLLDLANFLGQCGWSTMLNHQDRSECWQQNNNSVGWLFGELREQCTIQAHNECPHPVKTDRKINEFGRGHTETYCTTCDNVFKRFEYWDSGPDHCC